MKQIQAEYTIDNIFYLGQSIQRQTKIFPAIKNDTNQNYAVRKYLSKNKPRPQYDQWVPTKIVKENDTVVCQIMPFFMRDLEIINTDHRSFQSKLDIMSLISQKLLQYHNAGKIHGNIHPKNILFTQNLETVEFLDSLQGGNNESNYSSPQTYLNINTQAGDVWSLGITFFQLVVEQPIKNKLMKCECPPYLQPLFPQNFFLSKVQDESMRGLIKQMLNRNYEERISLKDVVSCLQQIKDQQAYHYQKARPLKYNQFRFQLLDQLKKQKIKQYTRQQRKKLPYSQYALLDIYSRFPTITFSKRQFKFIYQFERNLIQIQYSPSNTKEIFLIILYRQLQLPYQIRTKMDIRKLFLILYHTPEQRFEFYTNGQLLVKISSNIDAMIFNFPDKLNP